MEGAVTVVERRGWLAGETLLRLGHRVTGLHGGVGRAGGREEPTPQTAWVASGHLPRVSTPPSLGCFSCNLGDFWGACHPVHNPSFVLARPGQTHPSDMSPASPVKAGRGC